MEDVAGQWLGRLIDGRYAVEGVLGAGGMGVVLEARHKFTGQLVAIKVVRPELASNEMLQQRFLNEARAPSMIGHPGIATTTDAGRSSDGLLYLVMELLHGRSLRTALYKDELRVQDVRRILLELLDALVAAHARGFVHRDLKPDNVFLVEPGGSMKLLDFGIAKVVDSTLPNARTQAGSPMGTPSYMSPEQIHDPSKVDARTDQWAVGVMMFEMLTRRLPWEGPTVGALLANIDSQPPTPVTTYLPDATPQLVEFFAKVFSRDPAGRFADSAEMKQVLWSMPFGATTAGGSGANMTLVTGAGFAGVATPTPIPPTPQPFRTPPPLEPGQMNTPAPAGYVSVVQKPSNATPIVIGVVGIIGIVAIVLAIVLTRAPAPATAPQDGSGSQVAIVVDAAPRPVADASPPPTEPPMKRPKTVKQPRTKGQNVGAGSVADDVYAGLPRIGPGSARTSDAGVPPQKTSTRDAGPSGKAPAMVQEVGSIKRCSFGVGAKGSCKEAMACARSHPASAICTCVRSMSIDHERLFGNWWACYATCGSDPACVQRCDQNAGTTCSTQ